jgi:hypothetical protein
VWGDEMHDYLLEGYESDEIIPELQNMISPLE